MKKLIFLFVLVLMITVFSPLSSDQLCASEGEMASAFLIDRGIWHYENGELRDAMHEFSKALLVNPTSETAKSYLSRLGLEEGLYQSQQTHETRIAKLSGDIKNYQEQMAALQTQKKTMEEKFDAMESERHALKESISEKAQEVNGLKDQITETERRLAQQKEQQKTHIKTMEMRFKDETKDLARLTEKQKNQLVHKSLSLQNTRQELLALHKKLEGKKHQLFEYQDEMMDLSARNDVLREMFGRLHSRHDTISQELENFVYVHRNDVDELGDQLIYKEIDITQHQRDLMNRMDDLLELHETADQYRKQLDEHQELLDEKNLEMYRILERLD